MIGRRGSCAVPVGPARTGSARDGRFRDTTVLVPGVNFLNDKLPARRILLH